MFIVEIMRVYCTDCKTLMIKVADWSRFRPPGRNAEMTQVSNFVGTDEELTHLIQGIVVDSSAHEY